MAGWLADGFESRLVLEKLRDPRSSLLTSYPELEESGTPALDSVSLNVDWEHGQPLSLTRPKIFTHVLMSVANTIVRVGTTVIVQFIYKVLNVAAFDRRGCI